MKKRDIAQCDDTELTTQRPIDYRPAVHALAVGPSRQKIPDIVECHDTERGAMGAPPVAGGAT